MSVIVINPFLVQPGGDPTTLFVSGAGIPDANGFYSQTGTVAGRPKYTNMNGFYIQFNSNNWELFDSGNNAKYETAPGDDDFRSTWYVITGGEPAPTVS